MVLISAANITSKCVDGGASCFSLTELDFLAMCGFPPWVERNFIFLGLVKTHHFGARPNRSRQALDANPVLSILSLLNFRLPPNCPQGPQIKRMPNRYPVTSSAPR